MLSSTPEFPGMRVQVINYLNIQTKYKFGIVKNI